MTGTHRRSLSTDKGTQSPFVMPYSRNRAGSTSRSKPEIRPLTEIGDNCVNTPSPLKRSDAIPNLLKLDQVNSPSLARTKRAHHQVKKQISVDALNVSSHRESPFGTPKPIANPSIHQLPSNIPRSQRAPHPLSRGSVTSETTPKAQDKGNLLSQRQDRSCIKERHTVVDKFKLDLHQGENHFSTPDAFKSVKPLATAFMSTGLLSKRNRPLEHLKIAKPTPDTPCKRPSTMGIPNTPGTPGTPLGARDICGADGKAQQADDNPLEDYLFFDTEGDSSFIYASSSSEFDGTPHTPTRSLFGMSNGNSTVEKKDRKPLLFGHSPADEGGNYFLHGTSEVSTLSPARFESKAARLKLSAVSKRTRREKKNISTEPVEIPSILQTRFCNVRNLGHGEFSEVFLVQDKETLVKYAIKRSKKTYATNKERLRRQEEVSVLKQIGQHEHIVELRNSWEESGHLFMQMEYCENGSLDVFLDDLGSRRTLDEFRTWKILLEVALGMSFIHEQGYLHLDLKPANIFITFEGVLKIGDFGLSTSWPAPPHAEREGDREYIAPEVLILGRYDKPGDIFSLGLLMFEVAANIILPENGVSWQKLRSGDLSDIPRLSSSFISDVVNLGPAEAEAHRVIGNGGLDYLVRWMLQPIPEARPTVWDLLNYADVQWINQVRRAGAVIYEGELGPNTSSECELYMINSDSLLADDGEDWRMEM